MGLHYILQLDSAEPQKRGIRFQGQHRGPRLHLPLYWLLRSDRLLHR